MPSTIHVIGLRVAMDRYTPCMDSVGKNADEMNSEMNVSGNTFCTASAEPVRNASIAAKPPITSASTIA
jgi:hypothetical protein